MISGEGLVKEYLLGKVRVNALRGVSLSVQRGEFIALAGPSGSGKTTLLNILGCIEKPTAGTVTLDSRNTADLSRDELSELRLRRLGFVFQSFNLLPVLSALENVEFPLMLQGCSLDGRRSAATEALALVGLADYAAHRPNELSGGQRQRVAIARAIAPKPQVVLADEPTANLDHVTGQEIIALMRSINRSLGTTFIICSHDPKVIARTDRVVSLEDGRLVEGA